MDKNVIDNVKKEQIKIHRITGRMSPLQSTGNLRICAVSTINVSGENDFRNCPLRKFEFYSISHLREGGGMYWSEETGEVELTAPAFIIVPPDILNRYGGANGKKYIEDAVCFYGPLADKLAELGILKPGIFPTSQKRQIPEIQKYFCNPSNPSTSSKPIFAFSISNRLIFIVALYSRISAFASAEKFFSLTYLAALRS